LGGGVKKGRAHFELCGTMGVKQIFLGRRIEARGRGIEARGLNCIKQGMVSSANKSKF